ncbi:hypothetical protein I4U23_015225 [Adineta vaga]|nr:hypothetical protein I4U23_015225 [Adineta vaga]
MSEYVWFFFILILTPFVIALSFFSYGHIWSLESFYNGISTNSHSTTEISIETTLHWIRTINDGSINSYLLTLVLTKDKYSWGRNSKNSSFRTFLSFLNIIKSSHIPASNISLGLLTSSKEEYIKYKKIIEMTSMNYGELFTRVHIIYHPGFVDQKQRTIFDVGREERHDYTKQKERRRLLSRLRNYLMISTLQSEDHIIWLDADVYFSSNILLKTIIKKSIDSKLIHNLPLGLLTTRCAFERDPHSNYDLNAWLGPRRVPNAKELDHIRNGGIFVGRPTKDTKMLDILLEGTVNEDLIKLDSVGGTILYIKADLIRQGLVFPPYYIIGTEWNMQEGWDGIETEGLCYIARNLGHDCYALGGDWVVTHTNY